MHWSADMAVRLLGLRQQLRAGQHVDCAPWLQSLPTHVATPLEYTPAELDLIKIGPTVVEILSMREAIANCYQELQPRLEAMGCAWPDFLWAVQVRSEPPLPCLPPAPFDTPPGPQKHSCRTPPLAD